MKFEELEETLKSKIENVYIINGGESYLTTKALSLIENKLNLAYPDFNKIIFSEECNKTAEDVISACQVLPFYDEKRLIVVNDFIGKKNDYEKKTFLNYFQHSLDNTCLVFFSTIKSEFFSSLEGKVTSIDCEKVSPAYLTQFATKELKSANREFVGNALTKLLDYCNNSITKLFTEISKLKTINIETNQITPEIIETYVTKDIEYIIFDLTNAISSKQNDRVFTLIDAMLKNKEQPTNIIAMLANHFRRLFLIARSEFPSSELAEMLGVKEFAITKYREQSKNFTQRKLKEIYDYCIEVEFMAKNGKMEAKNAVNYLIGNILK